MNLYFNPYDTYFNVNYSTFSVHIPSEDENKMPWVCAECAEDDDVVIDSVGHLPLFVESYTLTNNSECLTVRERQCLMCYSGTSNKGPSEIGTTSLQRTLVAAPC